MRPLRGVLAVPGDKSIAHRACIVAALATGESRLAGLPDGADVRATMGVLAALGVAIAREGEEVRVRGVGLRGLRAPAGALDCGNSGTTLRLMAGVLAGQRGTFVLDGDASLRRRPMGRIARPLAALGANVEALDGDRAPLTVRGAPLRGAEVATGVASAQVKSALLLAGLLAEGPTTVVEPAPTRDHTERLLRSLGVDLRAEPHEHGRRVRVEPPARLPAQRRRVPGDFSTAAFWLAAAALVPGSEVTVTGVGLNPGRTGFLDVLRRMGADVAVLAAEVRDGEPVGDVRVRHRPLEGVALGAADVVPALDELPLVAVLAATATGETVVRGAAELRVKESDRVEAMTEGLRAMGARIESRPDGWRVEGVPRLRGAAVATRDDHRVAMALTIAGLVASGAVRLDRPGCVAVSHPGFFDDLERLASGGAPW